MQQNCFIAKLIVRSTCFGGTIMPIIRSSKFIQIVAACVTWRFGLQVVVLLWRNIPQPGHITHSSTPDQLTCKPKRHVPQAANICINFELLMMGIMVSETCWADNKFCNKNQSVASSWPFIFPGIKVFHRYWVTIQVPFQKHN